VFLIIHSHSKVVVVFTFINHEVLLANLVGDINFHGWTTNQKYTGHVVENDLF
jgi:predicted CDP-diglyceride synthetase/phosphatidate cytidylyltransferase